MFEDNEENYWSKRNYIYDKCKDEREVDIEKNFKFANICKKEFLLLDKQTQLAIQNDIKENRVKNKLLTNQDELWILIVKHKNIINRIEAE